MRWPAPPSRIVRPVAFLAASLSQLAIYRRTRQAAAAACIGIGAVGPAAAQVVVWPTYLRMAPSRDGVVIGELERGKRVTLRDCAQHWCRAEVDGATGFVNRDNIGAVGPAITFEPAGGPPSCFESRRAGYENGQPYTFCPRLKALSPAPGAR
jgi:hypothetical protein